MEKVRTKQVFSKKQMALPLSSAALKTMRLRDRREAIALLAKLLLEAAGREEIPDESN